MAQGGLKKKGGGEGPAHYKATSPHPLPHSGDGPWGGVGGCSTRGSARDVSTRYLQNSRDPSQHRPTSIAPPPPNLSTQQPGGPAPLTTLAISRGPAPLLGHIQPAPQLPQAFRNPLLAPLPPQLLGSAPDTRTQAAHMQQPRACSSAWARASLPSPAGPGQGWRPPQHPKQDDKQKETDQDGGQPPPQAAGGRGGRGRGGRKERAGMQLGTNLLLLYQILSQSTGVC